MRPTLTPEAFSTLLDAFDSDRERAAEKYEQLRHTLIRFFEWRSAPFPDEHADETFDRVSRKIGDLPHIDNIGGYCYEVARLVCLEALKGGGRKFVSLDAAGAPTPVAPVVEDSTDQERRLACLDDCLQALPSDRRELILEYLPGRQACAHRPSESVGRALWSAAADAGQSCATASQPARAVCRRVPPSISLGPLLH